MGKFVIRRLLQTVLVLIGATLLLFGILFLRGNPVQDLGGDKARDPAVVAELTHRYHLDRSFPVQYYYYATNVFQGDLGVSYRQSNRSVTGILQAKVPNTAKLAGVAILIEVLIGLIAGIVSAVYKYSFADILVTVTTTFTIGIPVFVIGLVLQQIFVSQLQLLPLAGQNDGWKSYVLPAITLAAIDAALVARLTRSTLLEVLRADYIRTATAKGLTRRVVILKHALRNSIIPVVTYLGISFGALLGGALVTETLFQWDGVGRALITAIGADDRPIVIGAVTYGVFVFAILNLLVDVAYAYLDPRIRLE